MNISDIIQLVVLCALIFSRSATTRHSMGRIRNIARALFVKPRYVKPAGTLTRAPHVKANRKHD
jgi:cellulose biosynthesis operon protein BcsF/YhjT